MNFDIFSGSSVQWIFRVMSTVIFLGAFIWAANIIALDIMACYRRFFVELPRRRRSRKMLERAKKVGCVVVYNSERGVSAICTRQEFDNEIVREKSIIDHEEDGKKKIQLLLHPSLIVPFSLFTFAKVEESNHYVTGTEEDAEILFARILQKATGFSRNQVHSSAFKIAKGILTRREKRLFVPFIREGHMPNGELMPPMEYQIETYGGKTMKDAADYILSFV